MQRLYYTTTAVNLQALAPMVAPPRTDIVGKSRRSPMTFSESLRSYQLPVTGGLKPADIMKTSRGGIATTYG